MFGFGISRISPDNEKLIDNIITSFRSNPTYRSYTIEKDCISYADAGAIAIKVSKDFMPVNMFLFYPSEVSGYRGRIGSCSIYGVSLQGHYNAISNSKLMFGLPVESVSMESGVEPFVDVYFKL